MSDEENQTMSVSDEEEERARADEGLQFVTIMLELKERRPEVYEVMRETLRIGSGDDSPSGLERATLRRRARQVSRELLAFVDEFIEMSNARWVKRASSTEASSTDRMVV